MAEFDMHIHSVRSADGLMTVGEIITAARRRGLGGIAVSDHNSFAGALDLLNADHAGLEVIPAAELATELGHMLCYFLTEPPEAYGIRAENGRYPFEAVCGYVHACGGLIFAAHPYRLAGGDDRMEKALPLLDGVEIFNGRNTARRTGANDCALALAKSGGLPFSAGSDAHSAAEIGSCTRILHGQSEAELRAELPELHGEACERYSPLFYEACAGLKSAAQKKNTRRFTRNCAKLALSLWLDPTRRLRKASAEAARGRQISL